MNTQTHGVAPLSEAELLDLEALLRARRTELEEDGARIDEALEAVRVAREDSTTDDEHDPEGPTLTNEWSRLSGLRDDLASKLATVDGALAKIAAGTYGICTRDGAPIGAARLEARPEAELCIHCARELEARR